MHHQHLPDQIYHERHGAAAVGTAHAPDLDVLSEELAPTPSDRARVEAEQLGDPLVAAVAKPA